MNFVFLAAICLKFTCFYLTFPGLFLTYLALYLMEMGQPALLYLVPCTLGNNITDDVLLFLFARQIFPS